MEKTLLIPLAGRVDYAGATFRKTYSTVRKVFAAFAYTRQIIYNRFIPNVELSYVRVYTLKFVIQSKSGKIYDRR